MKEQLYQLFQGTTGAPTVEDLLLRVGVSVVIGLAIFVSYWISHAGTIYSQKFNINLITLTILTATVMTVIGNNIALSLGMVGALSIVRFRTAIKEPMDIAFLFWAIAGGIVLAAGMIPLAIFGSVIIGVIMIVFCNRKSTRKPYIAVISCADAQTEHAVTDYLKAHAEKAVVKSKSAQKGSIELSYEVTLKKDNTDFITELSEMDGVSSAVLVSYNGDYMG